MQRNPDMNGDPSLRTRRHSLTLDQVRAALPPVEGLRPLLELLTRMAEPDPDRRWSGAGEVESVGDRVVDPERIAGSLPALLEEVRSEAERSFLGGLRVLERLATGAHDDAAGLLRAEAERRARLGRLADAELLVEAALRLAGVTRDRRGALPIHLAAARIARARGRLEDAEIHYDIVFRLGLDGVDHERALTAAVGLGNLEVDRGRWDQAETRYDQAERLLEGLAGARPERWHLALNRSILAREKGNLRAAWKLLLAADEEAKALGDLSAVPIVENARGQVLLAMGEPEAAEAALRRALAAAGSADARITIGVNVADTLLARGRNLAAGEEARRAEDEAIRSGVVSRLPEVYRVLGDVALASENAEGFVFYERALEFIRDGGLPDVERARILERYGPAEASRGNHELARAMTTEARAIRARLKGEEAA